MANASSSRVGLRYVKEVTYGTTPASPVMSTVRRVPGGGGLQRNSQVVTSQEADSSRTVPDQVETGYSAAFDFNFELSAGSLDPFFIAILGGTTYTATVTAITISAAAAGNLITRSSGDFLADGFKPGMWVRISGFTGAPANNGLSKIGDLPGDVTATTLHIDPASNTLVNDAAGESVTISNSKMVRTGTANQDSFSFESHFEDLTNVYMQGVGFRPTTLSLDASAGAIVTGTVNFLGQTVTTSTTAFAGETVTPAGTTQSMNATSNVATLFEGGVAIATLARQVTININPNVTELRAISHAAAAGLIDGTFDIQVGLNLFFSDLNYITKVINRTPTSLMLPFSDAAGNHIIFSFPKGYLSGTPKEQGQNTPVAQDLTFTPVRYTGYADTPSMMMQIDMVNV